MICRCCSFTIALLSALLLCRSTDGQVAKQTSPIKLAAQERAACLEVLRQGFASDEFWPSIHAAEGLIAAGRGEEVVPQLRERLQRETDHQRRCGLARELVRAGDRTAARWMLAILDDPTSNGITHACESLYKVSEIGDGRRLRMLLADSSDKRRQLMAAAALAKWGNAVALQTIRDRLTDSDPEIVRVAAWILARIGDESDMPRLRQVLPTRQDPLSRAYVTNALANLGDPSAQEQLLRDLAHHDAAVRTYAATFAGEVRDPRYAEPLKKLLRDPTLDVRIRAAHSLIELASDPPFPRTETIRRDVFPATADSPRWSEGSMIQRRDGSLLFCVTEFRGGASDFSSARLVGKISHDDGRTWSRPMVMQPNIGQQNVMSASLSYLGDPLEPQSQLGLFFLVKHSVANLNVFLRRSADDGRSFGKPQRVTSGVGYFVMNNDRVLRLRNGRLLAPTAWTRDVRRENHFVIRVWLSDDNGKTWRESKTRLDYAKRGAMEPDIVELASGRLLMIARTQLGHIAVSHSDDAGATWSDLTSWGVAAPESPATLRVIPSTGDLLLVWNPTYVPGAGHGGKRTPLVAAVSRDQGKSWSRPVTIESSTDHTFAYTSLTFARGRALMSYYVRDEQSGRLSSRFYSVPISRLYQAHGTLAP